MRHHSWVRRALAVGACISTFALGACAGPATEEQALEEMREALPELRTHQEHGRTTRLYGTPMSSGASPSESAERFVRERAVVLGTESADLVREPGARRSAAQLPSMDAEPDAATQAPATAQAGGDDALGVMFDPATGRYAFSLVRYRQQRAGFPVFGGELGLLVRNEPDHPLVLAASAVRPLGNFVPAMRGQPAGQALQKRTVVESFERTDFRGEAIAETGIALTRFSRPEPVIFAGDDATPSAPRLAVRYVADNADDVGAPQPEKWLIVADAETGQVLYKESLILFDVQGSVHGLVTDGPKAMQCSPELDIPFPDAQVDITGGGSAFTDADGGFSIAHAGPSPVTVTSAIAGRYFDVTNQSGASQLLSLSVTQPGPADFLHNAANTDELVVGQVNGYANASEVRGWALSVHPTYPVISTQLDFPVRVNIASGVGYCPGNAWYDYSSINFCRAASTYGNTSFASVSQHEYGHHLVTSGGSGQGAYGEGMSDVIAMLIADDPGLGYGFYAAQCNTPLRTADNVCQYSASCSTCGSEAHACGQLISGAVWDVRDALLVTNPTTYLSIVSRLAVNSILLHTGTAITSQIAIDFLTLDDDDANLDNGTPHRNEICQGFGAHNLPCPVLPNYFTVTLPASATEGSGVLAGQGTVSMLLTSATPVTANLASSNPALASVPATVVIPPGSLTASFDLTLGDDAQLNGSRTVGITASGPIVPGSASLVVHDDEVGVLTVEIPANVTEGDGLLAGQGLVTVDAPVGANVTVTLASSDTSELGVPASVVIPSGSQSATFDVSVANDSAIDGPQTANVTASVVGWTSGSALTTVADDETLELTLVLPGGIPEGAGALPLAGSVQISGTLGADLEVSLASARPDLLGVPAVVVIPAGSVSVGFDLTPIDDTTPELTEQVALTAQAGGFADGVATLEMLDDDANYLTVTLIGATPAQAGVPLTVRVEAIGAAGTVLAGYGRSAAVSGSGDAGAVSVSPTSVAHAGGVFQGGITVGALASGVVLTFTDDQGATGQSPAFDVVPGSVASFELAPIASTLVHAQVPVTITARDANGYVATSFAAPVQLSAQSGRAPGPVKVLSFVAYSNDEYAKTLTAIRAHFTDFAETSTTSTDPATLATLLADKDVFLIPEQETATLAVMQSLGTSWASMLSSFVQNGGTVIACSYNTGEHEILSRAGLLTLPTPSSITSYTVTRSLDHPLTAGVPTSFAGSNLRYFYPSPIDPSVIVLLNLVGYPNSALRNVGTGHAVLIGTDFTTTGTPFDRVIANAVAWSREGQSSPLAVTPTLSGAFDEGLWTGEVSFPQPGSSASLTANDEDGHSGTSAPFDVVQLGVLSLSAPASGVEGDVASAVLTVSVAPAADLVVALASSDASEATLPASATIAAGTYSTGVVVDLVDDALLDGTQQATLSASTAGYASASVAIAVQDDETVGLSLSLPASVTEGAGVLAGAGTVTLDRPADAPLPIALASSDAGELAVPAQVIVPAGQTSASFDLTVPNDGVIDGAQIATITATYGGATVGTTVSVLDDEPLALSIAVASGLTEHSGTFWAVVSLAGTVESDLVVALSSSDPAQADLPASAVIAAGTSMVAVPGTITQDAALEGQHAVTLQASSAGFDTGSTELVITDDEAHHFAWDPIGDPQTAGVAFAVGLRAYGPDDLPAAYQGSAALAAAGSAGSLPVAPPTAVFTEGVFGGPIAIAAVGEDFTVLADGGEGLQAESNAFDLVAGPIARFTVSNIPETVTPGEPVPVTITALDANGFQATSYEGSPALSVLTAPAPSTPLRVLSYVAYSNNEYANTLAAIRTTFTNFTETSTTTASASTLQSLLASADVFLIVEQETASLATLQSLGTTFGAVLSQFVNDGGTVIACSFNTAEHELLGRASLFTLSGGGSVSSGTLTRSLVHTLTEGVSATFSAPYLHHYTTVSAGTEVPVRYSSNANVIARSLGRGHAVMIGTDFYTLGSELDRVIGNAVQWARGAGTVPSSPGTAGPFVAGVWTGTFVVDAPAAQALLFVDDGAGHTGESNRFDASADADGDGIDDVVETAGCTDWQDADSDEDGLEDGAEDPDHDGTQSAGETNPCAVDSDADGLQDGQELGTTTSEVASDTDLGVFEPDLDPSSTTNPLLADSDGDGVLDGAEDADHDGMVDAGETDPNAVEAPTGLGTTNIDYGVIRAQWSTTAPASRLYRSLACEGPYTLVYEGPDAFVEDHVPSVCTPWFYRAAAISSFGVESAWTSCHGEAHWCCDDGLPCTVDGFDGSACTVTPVDAACDDGAFCNGSERCDMLYGCGPGSSPTCDDGNACTSDACDSGSQACRNLPLSGTPCDDGNACSGGDSCATGFCAGPADLCRPEGDIFFDNFAAGLGRWTETGEGDWNTETLHASTGYPAGASGSPAAHSDACGTGCSLTTATVIDLRGYRSATLRFLRFVDVELDAGEYLRLELWNGTSWVQPVPDWTNGAGDTNDWRQETVSLAAYLGRADFSIRFSTRSSLTSEHVHVDDVRLTVEAIECVVDADCDDDDLCNGAERCVANACVAGTSTSCDDGDPCTTDTCHPSDGCQTELNTDPCEDGDPCTVNDACDAGVCQSGGPRACTDGNACTDDRCEPFVGCLYDPNTASCNDGNACTGGDQCSGGTCVGPIPMCVQPIFFDNFASGLGRWTETGEGDWNTEALHTSSGYPATGSGAPAAHSDNCSTECRIELTTPINLTLYGQARLELLRFVDSELDSGEYLRVELWNGSTWVRPYDWTHGAGDDNVWHAESIDLAPYLGVTNFRVRVLTRSSLLSEHVHVDDVRILAL